MVPVGLLVAMSGVAPVPEIRSERPLMVPFTLRSTPPEDVPLQLILRAPVMVSPPTFTYLRSNVVIRAPVFTVFPPQLSAPALLVWRDAQELRLETVRAEPEIVPVAIKLPFVLSVAAAERYRTVSNVEPVPN
jgi:hypothetical protein